MQAPERGHAMPFGARCGPDGAVFRLWAPAARRVELLLREAGGDVAARHCEALADGWFEHRDPDTLPGRRYRFRIDGELEVPDPASRFNPEGVHAECELIDPAGWRWTDQAWFGRPWRQAVIYELHVGAFSPGGGYDGVVARLDELADLGVTVLELMPLATFAGERGWGYDGVLPFAPHPAYGRPEDLKALVDEAHRRGLSVLLDVVYNHFGPEGNFLHRYAPAFFTGRHRTPWGDAINFDGPDAGTVRDFFIHNALYWLEEYHLDGLRIDAVHAICDDSARHFVDELVDRVEAGPGAERHVHIVLENHDNRASLLRHRRGRAAGPVTVSQWNDDFHHAVHRLLTGETDGYYVDYADAPLARLGRALAEGFVYQGEFSQHSGQPRGEPSADLPPECFVNFLQNHDQVGNRAMGERLAALSDPAALETAMALLLLAPQPPLLFMGEEYASRRPFHYFCDFQGELRHAVTAGRREEFAAFPAFADPEARERIPDPCDPGSFEASRLSEDEATQPPNRAFRERVRELLALRRDAVLPELERLRSGAARYEAEESSGRLLVHWPAEDGAELRLELNLGERAWEVEESGTCTVLYGPEPRRPLPPRAMRLRRIAPRAVRPAAGGGGEERGAPGRAPPAGRRRPLSTYRVQLHGGFRLARLRGLVPYFARLGVSHLYLSPLLKARPGSTHGYDVIDYGQLNPELGVEEDLEALAADLRAHDMGLVLDVVPNHMGIMADDNAWWLDVLEHGPAARYAGFFDIDWRPLRASLHDRVLVPVLGAPLGEALERGEIRVAFVPAEGTFSAYYHDHRFPLDPGTYPLVLAAGHEVAGAELPPGSTAREEFDSLLTAFERLPGRNLPDAATLLERYRDQGVLKRRLLRLCEREPAVLRVIEAAVAGMNEPRQRERLGALLDAQAFRLSYWRVAGDEINYRRFFDINQLAALRMDRPEVFAATHGRILEWVERGIVDGLRIDHPDGLYDPAGYFEALQRPFREGAGGKPPVYVVVEKILADHERLPEEWPVHGTTGYEFGALVTAWLVDGSGEEALTRAWQEFAGGARDFEPVAEQGRRDVMRHLLAAELTVLTTALDRIAQSSRTTADFTWLSLRDALVEVIARFPVYRTYVSARGARPEDRRHVEWAVARARTANRQPDASVFDFIREVLVGPAEGLPPEERDRRLAFAMQFQQVSAPVMAKGVEDTALYRYHRLVALNEVGASPERFGASTQALHQANAERAARWPASLLATSTHDTKRAEDTRARLAVLSELPGLWRRHVRRWSRLARSRRSEIRGAAAPARTDEYLFYQSVAGTWPVNGAPDDEYRQRIRDYMRKAAREARLHTDWQTPDEDYEKALDAFVMRMLAPGARNAFSRDMGSLAGTLHYFGFANSVSQLVLKLTAPGVPDLYQGSELPLYALVDPDNRRPVDFAARAAGLDALEAAEGGGRSPEALEATWPDDGLKLHFTRCLLALRRRHAGVFAGASYEPLAVEGPLAEHVCAFARRGEHALILVIATRWHARAGGGERRLLLDGAWEDTRVRTPFAEGLLIDVLTGDGAEVRDGELRLRAVLRRVPCAVLELRG